VNRTGWTALKAYVNGVASGPWNWDTQSIESGLAYLPGNNLSISPTLYVDYVLPGPKLIVVVQ
jgi:hypothetical protein